MNELERSHTHTLIQGRYKCEVSAEAPNFQTVYDVAEMSVVGE